MPSGENATELIQLLCASKDRIDLPLVGFHNLSVLSSPPESARVPSGEKATERTQAECPCNVRISLPLAASHSLRVLSALPESRRVPVGGKGHRRYLPCVALEGAHELAGIRVPQLCRFVSTSREQERSVARERHRPDPMVMAIERPDKAAGGSVPQLDFVPAAGEQPYPVWGDTSRKTSLGMAPVGSDQLTCGGIP